MGLDITFFVACFNEEKNILNTLNHLNKSAKKTGLKYEIIIIDDHSKDKSKNIVKGWIKKQKNRNFKAIFRTKNMGLAINLIKAIQIAKGKNFRLICGDDVEQEEALTKIFNKIGKADLILPYHTKCPGKTKIRLFLSTIYTNLVNILTNRQIRYYNGLPVASTEDFKKFCRPKLGFSFQADFISQCIDAGKTYLEVPIKTVERQHGKSKALTLKNFIGAFHLFRRILKRKITKKC